MKLLEPITVGKTTFKNRLMFPPLTTGYEEKDGSIGEQSFRFYERLAKGGVGYIVIGDVAPLATFYTKAFFSCTGRRIQKTRRCLSRKWCKAWNPVIPSGLQRCRIK